MHQYLGWSVCLTVSKTSTGHPANLVLGDSGWYVFWQIHSWIHWHISHIAYGMRYYTLWKMHDIVGDAYSVSNAWIVVEQMRNEAPGTVIASHVLCSIGNGEIYMAGMVLSMLMLEFGHCRSSPGRGSLLFSATCHT